jgi:hypothetical protein
MILLTEHPETAPVSTIRPSIGTLCLALLVTLAACGDDPAGITAPLMVITSPATGLTVAEGSLIRLEGSGTDSSTGRWTTPRSD